MWRTIIEVNTEGNWEPLFPIWFGEPAEPCFIIESDETFTERANLGFLRKIDEETQPSCDELNFDLDSQIYETSIDELSVSTTWAERGDVKSFCAAAQSLLIKPGIRNDQARILFYRSATLDTK